MASSTRRSSVRWRHHLRKRVANNSHGIAACSGLPLHGMATPFQITVDCVDADVMTRFWSVALGYVEEPPPAGYLSWEDFLRANDITIPPPGSIGAIVDPEGVGPRVLF